MGNTLLANNYNAGPSNNFATITPSDSEDLTSTPRAIYIGTGGDVKLNNKSGTAVTFKNVQDGQLLPVVTTKIYSTDTTATDIIAIY